MYCARYGYDYEYVHVPKYANNISPYWLRVYQYAEYFKHNTAKWDIVVYLDLDAVFVADVPLEYVLARVDPKSTFSAYFGEDDSDFVNSGVVAIRTTDIGTNLVNAWKRQYENTDRQRWKLIDSRWSCHRCKWAGDGYEQRALSVLYASPAFAKSCILLPRSFFSNRFPDQDSYMLHMYASRSNKAKRAMLQVFQRLSTIAERRVHR